MIQINLNDTVYFKLTSFGKEILNREIMIHNEDTYMDLAGNVVASLIEQRPNGYFEMQLYDFMRIFGSYMQIGAQNMIIEENTLMLNGGGIHYDN